MTASRPRPDFLVVGANHRSSDAALRDRLFTEEAEAPFILARLRASGLGRAVWLSTCDRIEIYAIHPRPIEAALVIGEVLAARAGMDTARLAEQLVTLTGDAAVRHIFAVACSLESRMIGEPHVLGQVKTAHRLATLDGALEADLEALFQAAYAAAKRVRTETAIAERPVSIAAAALGVAGDLHGDLGRCSGLLIGVTDIGELLVDHLRDGGLGRLAVIAEPDRRAAGAARRFGCRHAAHADLDAELASADIVVAASGAGRHILNAGQVNAALRRRRRRPIFVIDAGIPREVDPAVGDLSGAFVYDLDDFERIALDGRMNREKASAEAWAIVDRAAAAFLRGRAERQAVPSVAALRRHFERVRDGVLAERNGDDAGEATRLLINRLLHNPSEALRRMAADPETWAGDRIPAERLLAGLFGLDDRDFEAVRKEEPRERGEDEGETR